MDGERVLEYLFHLACENYQWSIFGVSAFVMTVTGTILFCVDSKEELKKTDKTQIMSIQHDMGCLASTINKLTNDLTLRLDLQNEEQSSIRKIVNKLQEKQERIEESLYSSE